MFEPLVDHIPKYQEKMSKLLKQSSRFRLHKYAVGAETRRIQMHILTDDPFGSTALEMKQAPKDAKRIEVDMITIDEAIKAWNLPVPNVIKMDTQGSELTILQGAQQTLPQVDVLLCETWLIRAYGPATPLLIELMDWLRDWGFYLWDFGDVYRDKNGMLLSPDCIFLNARNKISLLGDELSRRRKAAFASKATPALKRSWKDRLRRYFR
jgi:FkbM family methyltransferase